MQQSYVPDSMHTLHRMLFFAGLESQWLHVDGTVGSYNLHCQALALSCIMLPFVFVELLVLHFGQREQILLWVQSHQTRSVQPEMGIAHCLHWRLNDATQQFFFLST